MMSSIAVKLLIGIAVLAAVACGAFYEGHHLEAQAFQDYKDKQTGVAEHQVATNQTAVAAITASEAAALRQTADDRQEQIDEIQKRNDGLVAANGQLAGKLRNYVNGARSTAALVSSSAAGAGSGDGTGEAALSDGFSNLTGWITHELHDADIDAINLNAAQQIIVQDRQICTGALPGITGTPAPAIVP